MADKLTTHGLVLLSGGMDSAACLAFALHRGESVAALHVDYGHAASEAEAGAAEALCRHYAVPLVRVNVGAPYASSEGYLHGRNLLLVSVALSQGLRSGLLYIGLHRDAAYVDCSPLFVEACQRVIDVYHAGAVRLTAPFADLRKSEIAAFCFRENVPLQLTYSCERGEAPPCGECLSCRDRKGIGA